MSSLTSVVSEGVFLSGMGGGGAEVGGGFSSSTGSSLCGSSDSTPVCVCVCVCDKFRMTGKGWHN